MVTALFSSPRDISGGNDGYIGSAREAATAREKFQRQQSFDGLLSHIQNHRLSRTERTDFHGRLMAGSRRWEDWTR
jgi:hypothetical protein